MKTLPVPPNEALLYEDEWLYVCLASFPITPGHAVVVWKGSVTDLHNLNDIEYDYLMEIVDVARDALLETFSVEKVYLMYMDEIKQVHWHLIPRYNEKGFNLFSHEAQETHDFAAGASLREHFLSRLTTRALHPPM